MHRSLGACLLATLMVLPAIAQTSKQAIAQAELNLLNQAQQALTAAEAAGAATLAKSLYDDAQWRIKFAQENWNASKSAARDQARLRADEALWAARAALAKAQWLGTNSAIRSLQGDIARFGGKSDLMLEDESPTIDLNRGNTSRTRADMAQTLVDRAKAAGAEAIPGNDLGVAQTYLNTVRKIVRGDTQSESADHLSYDAEMMARRAYYLARAGDSVKYLPGLQLERTRLAQTASEQQAAAERAQREQAQAQAAALQQQLAAEQANRQAQQAEVDRLRAQIDENRRAMQARVDADRQARLQAETQLDAATQRYLAAIATGNAAEIDTARRALEDQQIALRAIQERERLNEQALTGELDRMRSDINAARQANANAQLIASREADLNQRQSTLDALRREREADLAHRAEVDRANLSAISAAQTRRQEADAQAEALRTQAAQAQAQAAAAQQAAQQAQQAAQQQAAAAQQAAQQEAAQHQAELDRTRQQMQQAQAELEKARQDLAARDAEMRQARLQQEMAKLAATRKTDRGLIVTLPGIFFDTGKSDLKAGAKKTLTRMAEQLKNDSSVRVAVEGHTDNVGKPDKNQTLSEKRANAVRDFLVNAGVPADRITAKGLGESDPIATNKTTAGRQQNRRVELIITNG